MIDPFELHLVLKALFCNNDEAPILTLIYLDYTYFMAYKESFETSDISDAINM